MHHRRGTHRARLLGGAAFVALALATGSARAQDAGITIAPQPLDAALNELGVQSKQQVLIRSDLTVGRVTAGVTNAPDFETALTTMLAGTGLTYRKDGDTFLVVQGGSVPQSAGAGGDVDALIVTAQKREENIQDVPIAISAFSQEDLTRSQVAGGPDLMTQVPNMTFTKTNFSSYSIQLRGIGTQAISATTDAAVAVAFNNTPFIRNRFFEQEFYDLQRVEVLRGPQGTLYGRNATAGVVNIISAKPTFRYEARAAGDVGNFNSTRVEGMVNIPLVEDAAALRLAAAWTKRDGYATNQITDNPIDGRDLWSTRLSLRVTPTDALDVNLIWEHFQEDDDRLRSGKQLCKTDTVTHVGDTPIEFIHQGWRNPGNDLLFSLPAATFSQGCAPSSLYSPDSFGTPNGLSLPYYLPLGAIFLPTALEDPYVSRTQSTDLRVIESTVDPEYRAKSDLVEIQASLDLTEGLTLASETSYSADTIFSMQDYNRFNTAPGAWSSTAYRPGVLEPGPNGGVFCDPQIGCSDRLVAVDVSTARSRQFSQEFRLSSDYDSAFNFSLGANFLRYDTEDKYYVFINSLSLIAALSPYANLFASPYPPSGSNNDCLRHGPTPPDFSFPQSVGQCMYLDPNPIGSLNDQGHNYFLSKNPYKLISYAVFGEAYYQLADNLKITAGLRWTVDKKEAPRIPSWVLASNSVGYPIVDVVHQDWSEPTGRLTIDWKPDLGFTDETLLYASYAHGYKAGGANPPPMGIVCYGCGVEADGLVAKSATHPKTFDPEFVNALEIGAKNTLADGRLTLNLAAFYYDYTGYQISQIVDRSAVNLNFDADVWGLEVEADWRPLENLRLGFKGGYENTRVADGMKAVDLMDRTAGREDWLLVKPFPTFASNCILPLSMFERPGGLYRVGNIGGGTAGPCEIAYVIGLDPVTEQPYDPNTHITDQGFSVDEPYLGFDPARPDINNGEGFYKELGGKELPNAPHFTATITADYTVPLPAEWLMTLHTDLYYQSEAWTRIFNTEGYDKLKAYSNINFAAIFTNEDAGWKVMAYVKNVLDRDSITGSFLNSDDTGLTTNVFLTEPRLYGVRVTKDFTGGAWLGSFGQRHEGPYPFTVEIGGQVQRQDAPNQALRPGFAGDLSPTLDAVFDSTQDQDLDWGDGRDVRLTYRSQGPWSVSAAVRIGKTNSGHRYLASEVGDVGCLFDAPCPYVKPIYLDPFIGINYASGSVFDHEEHTIVDLVVGRDVGLGGGAMASRLSAGLRYAEFASMTKLDSTGIPDWQVPDTGTWFTAIQHHLETSVLLADRDFSGAGPVAAWEASMHLLDGQEAGRVDLDWSVEGGVLFGKQKTMINGEETSRYFNGQVYYSYAFTRQVGPTVTTPVERARSRSVTVPTATLSLGLSYSIDRLKVGAGYHWERYFDVLDGGKDAGASYDRTMDGPYLKVSVGFGG